LKEHDFVKRERFFGFNPKKKIFILLRTALNLCDMKRDVFAAVVYCAKKITYGKNMEHTIAN